MSKLNYREKIQEVGKTHSYLSGFNGTLGEYRISMIEESLSFSASSSILEVGAGEGQITRFLLGKNVKLKSLEPATEFYETLKKKFSEEPVEILNLVFEDYETDERFNYIFLVGVLEHIERPEAVLTKIRKYLKPEGKLIITVPNANSVHRHLGVIKKKIKDVYELGPLDIKVGHFRHFDLESLVGLVKKSGFSIDVKSGILIKNQPNHQMEKLTREELNVLYKIGKSSPEVCAELFIIAGL